MECHDYLLVAPVSFALRFDVWNMCDLTCVIYVGSREQKKNASKKCVCFFLLILLPHPWLSLFSLCPRAQF